MSTCRSCGAPIEWVQMATGRMNPLDVDVRPDGNIVIVQPRGTHQAVARYVPKGQGNRVSHFVTCPNATSWRRER